MSGSFYFLSKEKLDNPMRTSKLYSILEQFDKYEQNRCRKYIQSPYFNANEELGKLFEFIVNYLNHNKNDDLCKQQIWMHLHEDKEYDDIRFRKYCSDLLKLVEGFLAQQAYEANQLQQVTYLMESVRRKKMEKLYNSTMRSARRLAKNLQYKSATYYYQQYDIEKSYFELVDFDTKRSDKSNIEAIAHNLDKFYLAEKLKYYCEVLSRQAVVSHDYNILFIKEIKEHLNSYSYNDVPPIAVYYQIYLTMVDAENEKHYFKLKNLLEKYGLQFPTNEAQEIYGSALNYCVRRVNKGNLDFLKELFDLYKDLLEKKIILSDGELSPHNFKNIVLCALRLREYDWTEQFIHSYATYLPIDSKENAVTFNLARLYFYKQEYEKVISLLQEVEYEDVYYNLDSKVLLLVTYYEIDEIEPLYSLFESFRAYLNRHKDIPASRRRSFLNLIKYTKKLSKAIPGNKRDIDKIKEEIDQAKNIASIAWLKEKIAELEA